MSKKVYDLVVIALYAGIICIAITFIRIPMPVNFVHPGNALVAVSPLLMKKHNAIIASALGVFIFDLLNGYLSGSLLIVIEAIIVVLATDFMIEKVFKENYSFRNIAIIGVVDAILKMILVFFKYVFSQIVLGNTINSALIYAGSRMYASVFIALFTMFLVPTLYFGLKNVFKKFKS